MTQAATPPRIPPLPREEWTDAARDVFAFWEGEPARQNGSWSNVMMTLAQHPPLAMSSLAMGRYMMLESTLTGRQQKLIVLRVAWRNGSNYQWTHNSMTATEIGFTPEVFEALKEGAGAALWNHEDRLLLSVIDQLSDTGRIDDATWAGLTEVMSRQQIMDVIHAVGYFTMVAWGVVAMGVQLEPDHAERSTNLGKPA